MAYLTNTFLIKSRTLFSKLESIKKYKDKGIKCIRSTLGCKKSDIFGEMEGDSQGMEGEDLQAE